MTTFQVVGTFSDGPSHMLSWITDMELVQTGAGLRLYTATRAGGGLLVLGVEADGLTLLDQVAMPSGATLPAPAQLDVCTLNGQDTLLVTGANSARLGGYVVEADGDLGAAVQVVGSASGTIAAEIMVQVGGETFCYLNKLGDAGLLSYRVLANGQMFFLGNLISQGGFQGVDVAAFSSVNFGGTSYLLALSGGQDALRSYRIAADGALTQVASLGAAGGLGLAAPSALEVVHLAGVTYALVAGAGSSSISVVQIGANGSLGLTDHVVDTLDTRFQGVEALATARIGDRVFVVAGGGDDGLTLLTLLPNGRLLQLGEQLQVPGLALHNISDMTAKVIDGKIELFVAGQGLGITQLRIDPGSLAAMTLGSDGVDTLTGGEGNDLLSGRADDDLLQGGAGDDILMDGAGVDMMFGGAGADVFVLSGDGHEDVIRDFQVGIDRLDLSAWGRVYSTSALGFRNYPYGVIINFGEERLVIQASNNQRIPYSSFLASELFGLWHVVAEPVVAGVRVEGSPRQEVLTGDLGDDTLAGGGGADVIDGKAGYDYIDFSGTLAALIIDLVESAKNGGAAAGDTYISIEAVIGGSGDDEISGTAGANVLRGAGGNDRLSGRSGHDLLIGGQGDDTLNGGAGEDRLLGGDGRDRALYSQATAAVTADLQVSTGNKGDATGDHYDSIEDLVGSRFGDRLAGDSEANMLSGLAGDDTIAGRHGDDRLFGGDGRDRLQGGAGDDYLNGGNGLDTAVFGGTAAVYVDLTLTVGQNSGEGFDTFTGIENVVSGTGADRLQGNALANCLMGGAGNDTLLGADGNDTLAGGAGNDVVSGGAGRDWLEIEGLGSVTVSLARQGTQITGQGFDIIQGIECVSSGGGADTVAGNSFGNTILGNAGRDLLWGRDGNDVLSGGLGADTLWGGAGHDTLSGDLGNDILIGGAGIDTALFLGPAAVRVNLAATGGQTTGLGLDRLTGIENLISGSGNDHLSGNGLNNHLSGGAGHDTLTGGHGRDHLIGGSGSDFLTGGLGADTFVFNAGRDVISDFRGAQGDQIMGDQIRLDHTALHISKTLTVQQVITQFGHDLGASVQLTFGAGQTLTLQSVGSLQDLAHGLLIF